MVKYEVEFSFKVQGPAATLGLSQRDRDRLLEAHLDDVMVQLLNLDGVIDPSIQVTFSTGEVGIALTLKARSQSKAVESADALVRGAVVAAGSFTGGWEIEWSKEPPVVHPAGLVDA